MNEIERKEELRELATVNPMQLLNVAVQQGADIDKLAKLMDLQERWEANNARKAFTVAMAEFKKDPPAIVKDRSVSFGTTVYMHAGLDQVTDKIAKALSACGLSHRFEIGQQDAKITVTCVITHLLGHSERTTLTAGSDTSGGKNAIQGVGSAVSYLQRYTLLAATGLATGEGDDDGRGVVEKVSDKQLSAIRDLLVAMGKAEGAYCKYLKIATLEDLPEKNFETVKEELTGWYRNQKK